MELTGIDYFSIGASLFGILLFLYSAYVAMNIIKLLPEGSKAKTNWNLAIVLIVLFVFGYIGNIATILVPELAGTREIMVPLVFIFGAIFVVIMTTLSLRTYKIILESAE